MNAYDTGAHAIDTRLLDAGEAEALNFYRSEVYAEYQPVGISEKAVADEFAFNMLRRYRLEFAERAFFDKVHGMELVRLKDTLTIPELEVFVEIMIKLNPIARIAIPVAEYGYKVPGPPESKDEMIKRIEQRIALVGQPSYLVQHAHVGAETMALKEHLDRQRRGIFKDILGNISALKGLQKGRREG